MSKSSTTPSFKNLDFSEDWSSHPAIEWLYNNKKTILWIFIGLLTTLILAYRVAAKQTLKAESDFFQAQTAFLQFQQESVQDSGSIASSQLEQLENIMQRHPELKAKYDGPLAQTLLMTNQVTQGIPLVKDIFKRTQTDHLQLYQTYSQNSLLISEGKYTEALQQSQQLKQNLDQLSNGASFPLLYTFNLLRLALLHQQLNHPAEELQIWQQLQENPPYRDAIFAIHQTFKLGQATLNQYIEERKKTLNN